MKLINGKRSLVILILLFISACTGIESPEPTSATITLTKTASMVIPPSIDPVSTDTADGGLTDLGENVPTRTPEITAAAMKLSEVERVRAEERGRKQDLWQIAAGLAETKNVG